MEASTKETSSLVITNFLDVILRTGAMDPHEYRHVAMSIRFRRQFGGFGMEHLNQMVDVAQNSFGEPDTLMVSPASLKDLRGDDGKD